MTGLCFTLNTDFQVPQYLFSTFNSYSALFYTTSDFFCFVVFPDSRYHLFVTKLGRSPCNEGLWVRHKSPIVGHKNRSSGDTQTDIASGGLRPPVAWWEGVGWAGGEGSGMCGGGGRIGLLGRGRGMRRIVSTSEQPFNPRPANCTVFDGTVPYFDPCTVCTVQDWKCTIFFAKIYQSFCTNLGLKCWISQLQDQVSSKFS